VFLHIVIILLVDLFTWLLVWEQY